MSCVDQLQALFPGFILAATMATAEGPVYADWQIAAPARLVSGADVPSSTGAGGSFSPAFSGDGRFIAFVSQANTLVTNDDRSPWLDVFVRDLSANRTTLISVNRSGLGGGDGNSRLGSISSNGQFVAFASAASNLVKGDTNAVEDVFLRDLVTGTTLLISVGMDSNGATGPSSNPTLTPDARWVVFESAATNLVADDTNGIPDVFVHDLQNQTNYLISVGAMGVPGTILSVGSASVLPIITPNGQRVAFASTATNLVPGLTNTLGEIYVRDLAAGTTSLASRDATNFLSIYFRSFNALMSADGRFIVFKASGLDALSQSNVVVCRHDLVTGTTVALGQYSLESTWPAMSPDGRFVAFETLIGCHTQVVLWDALTGSNSLVSVDSTGLEPSAGTASAPMVSADGRKLGFFFALDLSPAPGCEGNGPSTNSMDGLTQLYLRDLDSGLTRLLSAQPDGHAGSDDLAKSAPALSADGSRLAFETLDPKMVSEDLNQATDVLVWTTDSGRLDLVSAADGGLPSETAFGLNFLDPNSLSTDGRFLVYSSLGANLTRDDTPGVQDIFVRDLMSGTNRLISSRTSGLIPKDSLCRHPVLTPAGCCLAFEATSTSPAGTEARQDVYYYDLMNNLLSLVSVSSTGSNPALGLSAAPSLSADGRWVAFHSTAADLAPPLINTNSVWNVFVRDLVLETNLLVSVSRTSASRSANGPSLNPLLSPDGGWLVFQSKATDLTTNRVDGTWYQLFARDLLANRATLLSVATNGSAFGGDSTARVFNATGRLVAFTTRTPNAGPSTGMTDSIYVWDLVAGTNAQVCVGCVNPTLSSDGRLIAYEATTSPHQIWTRDFQTRSNALISVGGRGGGTGGNGNSSHPQISSDGRLVAFQSQATDLVAAPAGAPMNIFVRDRLLVTTHLVSYDPRTGTAARQLSSRPMLAPDGRTIAFQSFADELLARDYNGQRDILITHLNVADTDHDGLDDGWELLYFGDLSRTGGGDFDGDGCSDKAEFLAGTDPANPASVLRVLRVTNWVHSSKVVSWSAVFGHTYAVEYTTNLANPVWKSFSSVGATNSTASLIDANFGSSPQRFYRVRLVE